MRDAFPSPTPSHGQKYFGCLRDEGGLLLRREHEVAIALLLVRQGRENVTTDTEIGGAHVGALFRTWQTEGEPSEIVYFHVLRSVSRFEVNGKLEALRRL